MIVDASELAARTGQEIAVSDWLTVDQATIDAFAAATHDRQFLHVDPERAKAGPFGGTIAHGFLTLALLTALMERSDMPRIAGVTMAINYGLNKVRFLTPVPSGARVRARFRLVELAEKRPGDYQQTMDIAVEIEGGTKPALAAEWIVRFGSA